MNLQEFAQLLGKPVQEAEEILKKNDIVTLKLNDRRTPKIKESFKMEVLQ